ncbi:MAG TPA: ATP synthase F1 subunit delta [Silvibacterium sp.]|nr:ATP synthase F1 subunit delta [Silvibacterium sp.]
MPAFTARYARALADVVFSPPEGVPHVRPEDAQSQLNDFAAAWHESADLREVFLDPSFSATQKVAILDKLNTRLRMSQPVRNFFAVLINHDRMESIDEVLSDFHHEMNTRLNIAEVEVTSARRLDEKERSSLESQIAQMTKGAITAKFREDPSLVGGVVVKIGSTVYDDSVRGRLNRLKDQLAAG